MSNRSVTYTLYLNGNVRQYLQDTEKAAQGVDNAMNTLQHTLGAVGVYLGAREIINVGKEWLQTAADYESAVLRIKNVSINDVQGLKNQLFISSEADKFKIDLQGATDAYGDFLTMVRGSGLASGEIRKLHDEVLTIGKVTNISAGQMDASVRNMGKLLEEGTLEGKHLRPLTYQLSGLMPYISKEMDMTNQQLEKFMSSGKMTKAAINSRVLLSAVEKYAKDLEGKLPESLNTIQSELNETSNAWERFKISVGGSREFRLMLDDVRDLVYWIGANRDAIFAWGKVLIDAVVVIAAYKAAMAAATLIQSAWMYLQRGSASQVVSSTILMRGQIATTNQMVAAIERLNYVLNANTSSFITNAEGVTMANTAANRYIISSRDAQKNLPNAVVANPGSSGGMGKLSSGLMMVGIAWMAADIIQAFGGFGRKQSGGNNSFFDFMGSTDWAESDEGVAYRRSQGIIQRGSSKGYSHPFLSESEKMHEDRVAATLKAGMGTALYDRYGNFRDPTLQEANAFNKLSGVLSFGKMAGAVVKKDVSDKDGTGSHDFKIPKVPKSSSIKGNSVTNITFNIHEINGQKACTFSLKSSKDMDAISGDIGTHLVNTLTQALNDSQAIGGHH